MRISKLNVDQRCTWALHKNSVTSSVREYCVFYGWRRYKISQIFVDCYFWGVGEGGGGASEKTILSFCKKQASVGVGRFKYKLVQNVSCRALFSLQLDSKFLESTSQNLEWEKILSILFIVRNKHWPSV